MLKLWDFELQGLRSRARSFDVLGCVRFSNWGGGLPKHLRGMQNIMMRIWKVPIEHHHSSPLRNSAIALCVLALVLGFKIAFS